MTARSHSRTRANIKRRIAGRRAVRRAKWERLNPEAAQRLRNAANER